MTSLILFTSSLVITLGGITWLVFSLLFQNHPDITNLYLLSFTSLIFGISLDTQGIFKSKVPDTIRSSPNGFKHRYSFKSVGVLYLALFGMVMHVALLFIMARYNSGNLFLIGINIALFIVSIIFMALYAQGHFVHIIIDNEGLTKLVRGKVYHNIPLSFIKEIHIYYDGYEVKTTDHKIYRENLLNFDYAAALSSITSINYKVVDRTNESIFKDG